MPKSSLTPYVEPCKSTGIHCISMGIGTLDVGPGAELCIHAGISHMPLVGEGQGIRPLLVGPWPLVPCSP